ncbi:MAG TPA: bifunctional nicotinamidase/pyrazinamidase [Catalimonadaceae bacterium]|nr:bifunctional nicotinamidase/pyrazinamidase [Catalimonadaceae bacterium]
MTRHSALLLVDIQYDFLEGGALAVPESADILIPVVALAEMFDTIVLTQDWHPAGHKSFASSHDGKNPYDTVLWKGCTEVLWPDHCVQNTRGAELHPSVLNLHPAVIIQKGIHPETDSYSAFFDNHREHKTKLEEWLNQHDIRHLVVAGLATDYCVLHTVKDALELGLTVDVFTPGCRAVNLLPEDGKKALDEMKSAGAGIRHWI